LKRDGGEKRALRGVWGQKKKKIFTLDRELGKKKTQGRQVWCACCLLLERIWEGGKKKKKKKPLKG